MTFIKIALFTIKTRSNCGMCVLWKNDDSNICDLNYRIDFVLNGTTTHSANNTIDLLRKKFPERIIARIGYVNWPPKFDTIGLFSLGLIKNSPQSIPEPKNTIILGISNPDPEWIPNVTENFTNDGEVIWRN